MDNNYWNDGYWKRHLEDDLEKLDFLDDIWIDKYKEIIDNIKKGKVLDLGCGLGQYTKYFLDKGFEVISADISIEALNNLKQKIPNANTVKLDMSKPLEFSNDTFDLVIANLSIHYFDLETTRNLISEIKRIIKPNGYFIGSVNSKKAYEFIKGHAVFLDDNYYFSKGRNIRLWDKEQFDYFFKDFEKIVLEETSTVRWNKRKDMWEFIYKTKK